MVDIANISEEYIKCYSDKSRIYMIKHFLKTYDATQKKEVPYNLFPKQEELCTALACGKDCCCTKARQQGITTTASAFLACEMALADPDSPITILAIGNTLDLAQQFVTKIKDFLVQLPRWFFGDEYWDPDTNDKKNKEKLFLVANQKELKLANGSRIVARSSGPDASRGVGGVSWLVFDEAAFIENGKDVYASAIATVSTGGHVIMISTPNGKDQLYYETYRQAMLGLNSFILVEMKWYQDPRYNRFLEWTKKNEDTGELEIIKEPTLDELGNIRWDNNHWMDMIGQGYKPRSPWYIGMCKKFNNNPQKIAQELDVSFLGSDSTVVDPEFIEMQLNINVKDPDPNLKDSMLEDTWVWKPPYEGHRYIMGIDNSTGAADDATALEIIDMDGIDEETGEPIIEQVLEYNGKLTGDIIGEIAYNYARTYNNAFIVVEDIGGYGSATLLTLMNLKYENLYYDDPTLKTYTAVNDATPLKATKDGLPGFHSNSVRFQMLSHFAAMVRDNSFKIRSRRVINQLDTWIFTKNGRMDHKDGCHDDTLTCCAMALFVMEYSIKRQERAINLDKTMLRSMITVNSRITYTEGNTLLNSPKNNKSNKSFPVQLVMSNPTGGERCPAYKANMWLFK